MLSGNDVARWFISRNPELASGYIDENTKINKLLYFSNLMYHCIYNENLISDDFIAFPRGPVIFSIYRDYRYNNLGRSVQYDVNPDKKELEILNIINFIYGNRTTEELVGESHTHSLWKNVEHLIPNNPKINFENIDPELIEYNKVLYRTYADLDFANLAKEKINDNIYYYFKNSFEMTDEIIEKLESFDKYDEPKFIEMINGELVMS